MNTIAAIAGTIYGLTAVILGAFGAHGLKNVLDERMLAAFETGTRYQMYHALFLLLLALMANHLPQQWLNYAIWTAIIGVLLFSGSIYLLTVFKLKIGIITPIGGLFLILSWISLLVGILTKAS